MSWRDHLTPAEARVFYDMEERITEVKKDLAALQLARRKLMKLASDRWNYAKTRPRDRDQ